MDSDVVVAGADVETADVEATDVEATDVETAAEVEVVCTAEVVVLPAAAQPPVRAGGTASGPEPIGMRFVPQSSFWAT
jgi:hypothetical protein